MKTTRYLLGISMMLSLAGCTNDDRMEYSYENDPNAVIVSADIIGTKANTENTGDLFTDGDMFVVKNLADKGREAKYQYDGEEWDLVSSQYLYWAKGNNSFQAWMPTSAGYDTFTLPSDQTTVSKLRSADWMTAEADQVRKPSDRSLKLNFIHRLAKVVVSVTAFDAPFTGNEKVTEADFLPAGHNVASGVSISGGDDEIGAYISGKSMCAVLAPGTYKTGDVFFRIIVGGQEMTVRVPDEDLILKSGNSYRFSLTVGGGETPGEETFAAITEVEVLPWEKVLLEEGNAYLEEDREDLEREALIALYNATDGDNWTNNENWCSDKPVSEWYGLYTRDGRVVSLSLGSNNLSGRIPDEIGNLTEITHLSLYDNSGLVFDEFPSWIQSMTCLEVLSMSYCNLNGSIPDWIGEFENLIILELNHNSLDGNIPSTLGNLKNLENINLAANLLTGGIPGSLGNLQKIVFMCLAGNYLTGTVPDAIVNSIYWEKNWMEIVGQIGDGLDLEGVYIPAPVREYSTYDLDGNLLDFAEEYSNNEYTVLLEWASWCPFSLDFIDRLIPVYDGYKSNGIEIIGITYGADAGIIPSDSEESIRATIADKQIPWRTMMIETISERWDFDYPSGSYPGVIVVKGDAVVFQSFSQSYNDIFPFFEDIFGPIENEPYESTDYSADGQVYTLQTATVGNGIDVVLMGDGYSDRMIADGTYRQVMEDAMEYLFVEEPYKTYRDHFNVYMINAVSKNEIVGESETVFSSYFGEGTYVGGDNNKVFRYAQKILSDERMDEAMIVIMLNSKKYAGTCVMYYPSSGDYGNGPSISYFPIGVDSEGFKQVLNHETNGHGFAKLDDEYAYEYMGAFPSSELGDRQYLESFGWWKNTDLTNDVNIVKWAHFLADERYKYDGLGVFEGGSTYWRGVWRPTYNSIMRHNTDGFNAPSREAIYIRIHKLAYGDSWQYDYEDFVKYDAINRKTSSSAVRTQPQSEIPYRPATPPVVVRKTWREAMEDAR